MGISSSSTRLYTWVDVEHVILRQRFAGTWPNGIQFTTYSDVLEVTVSDKSQIKKVPLVLAEWFGARYNEAKSAILLESTSETPRFLPVMIEPDSLRAVSEPTVRPTFTRLTLYPEGPLSARIPPLPPKSPPIIAFYSYKGGVGRTTHLVSLVRALSKGRRSRLLVVDADLEAPGLTWWVRDLNGPPEVSFLDFLALAQYDTSVDHKETIQLVSQRLKQQPVFLETSTGRIEHYFLPAFRDLDQVKLMPIRPEHLVQVPGQEWILSSLLAQLGRELEVQAVIVDLRAGMSEIASPMLFDPRIRRVLVTSTSSQSIEGSCAVLEEMRKLAPPIKEIPACDSNLFEPTAIISFVPPRETQTAAFAREKLLAAYPNPDDVDIVPVARLTVEQSGFSEALLHLDGLHSAFERLADTSVARVMEQLAADWFPEPAPPAPTPSIAQEDPGELRELRRRLAETARQLVMAESGMGTEFLRTNALEKLGHRFQFELPLAVVMGAKGAGKTYMFLQMLRRRTWGQFLNALGLPQVSEPAHILPLLQPKNLEPVAIESVASCQFETLTQLGVHGRLSPTETTDAIRAFMAQHPKNESEWRHFWVHLIGRALGFELDATSPESSLQAYLQRHGTRLIVAFDGLEDLFQDLPKNPNQQLALRALCQDLPNALRELPDRRIGLVIFVRKDLVKAAITQNFGQYERLHSAYELRWDPEEALRLAVWLCRTAGLPVWTDPILALEDAPQKALEEALYPVWGYKLGSESSREALTARWVLAALSDLAGRLQARDVMRFFRYAAARAEQIPEYQGRVLQPAAIRYAIEPCSREKLDEVQQEIPWLGDIFLRFRQAPDRRIPFLASDFDLTAQEVKLLTEMGIVLEQDGVLYMPEIFRLGLGFRLEKGARPKVISLMWRARGTP